MDSSTKIDVTLLNGEKVEVHWPSDEQWLEFRKARRVLLRPAGRGETRTVVEGTEAAALALFREISGREDFEDTAEAELAIDNLAAADVISQERSGEDLAVILATFAGEKSFSLRRPSAKHIKRFRSASFGVQGRGGVTEIRTNLGTLEELFDELCPEGKAEPIIYKAQVVSSVCGDVDQLLNASERP